MFAPHKHLLSAALASHPLLMSGLFWLTHNYIVSSFAINCYRFIIYM